MIMPPETNLVRSIALIIVRIGLGTVHEQQRCLKALHRDSLTKLRRSSEACPIDSTGEGALCTTTQTVKSGRLVQNFGGETPQLSVSSASAIRRTI